MPVPLGVRNFVLLVNNVAVILGTIRRRAIQQLCLHEEHLINRVEVVASGLADIMGITSDAAVALFGNAAWPSGSKLPGRCRLRLLLLGTPTTDRISMVSMVLLAVTSQQQQVNYNTGAAL